MRPEDRAFLKLRTEMMLPHDRLNRIENIYGDGTPDANYCIEGSEGWIEIKCPNEPEKLTSMMFAKNHRVSQDQLNWFKIHSKAFGRGYYLIISKIRQDKPTYRWSILRASDNDDINRLTVEEIIQRSLYSTIGIDKDKLSIIRRILKNDCIEI